MSLPRSTMLRILQKSSRPLAVTLAIALIVGVALWVGLHAPSTERVEERAEALTAEFVPVDLDEEPVVEEAPVEQVELAPEPLVGQAKAAKKPVNKPVNKQVKKQAKRETYKQAVLQVVTNFEKADVTVNGLPYPEYVAPGEPEGVVLPAGGPYYVEVKYDGKSKSYQLHLRPYETRLLIVELSGYQGNSVAPRPSAPSPRAQREEKKEEKKDEDSQGKVTVYSKPPGTVIIDGEKRSDKTPGTVDVEAGRHEVQVEYEDGGISEKKIVRVRKGSRIKLFFRKRNE